MGASDAASDASCANSTSGAPRRRAGLSPGARMGSIVSRDKPAGARPDIDTIIAHATVVAARRFARPSR